jgi:hypothetical protein
MEIDFNEVYEEFHPKILYYLSRLTNIYLSDWYQYLMTGAIFTTASKMSLPVTENRYL